MIFIKLIISILVLIALVYYAMLILHCFGIIKFTDRRITFSRCLVPFYYWIASYMD